MIGTGLSYCTAYPKSGRLKTCILLIALSGFSETHSSEKNKGYKILVERENQRLYTDNEHVQHNYRGRDSAGFNFLPMDESWLFSPSNTKKCHC